MQESPILNDFNISLLDEEALPSNPSFQEVSQMIKDCLLSTTKDGIANGTLHDYAW
jgi:hypothetical protein